MARIRLCLVAAVALGLVSCQDHGSPTSPQLSADFRDALHGVGRNPHFYLLPPLVSAPDLTKETFESGLQPSVRITELTQPGVGFAGCTNEQIAYIPATEFTRLKAYAAFWRPANFPNVAPPCIYRLQVEVLGKVLGFADVQVLSKTTIKYLKTDQVIPLPKDLTLPFWFFIGQGAVFFAQTDGTDACRVGRDCVEAIVSPTKTTTVVTKNQHAGILIPAGSFAAQITLVIEEQTERPCIEPSNLGLPQFNANRTGCYRFRRFPADVAPSDAEGAFLTVAMCVEIGGLTHPGPADRLQIFRFDPEAEAAEAQALANAPADFLPCEATRFLGFSPRGVPALLERLRSLFAPQPLHAATTAALIHVGVGGVCALRKCLSTPIFTWGIPGAVTRNSTDPQTAASAHSVAVPPSVLVTDLGEAPLANATVIFQVSSGGGSIATPAEGTGGVTDTVVTDGNGVATLGRWTLGATPGTNTVRAVVAGAVGSPVTFTATGLTAITINFDLTPTGAAVTPGTVINSVYATQGVTFTKLGPGTNCGSGPDVYANGDNPGGVGNTVSTCPQGTASDISANSFGVVQAAFALAASRVCIDVRPPAAGFAFLEALDAVDATLGRTTSSPGVNQTLCISGTGIRSVRFSGEGDNFARFDNLLISF